jgi:hypothetical protein
MRARPAEEVCPIATTLSSEILRKMDAYWRGELSLGGSASEDGVNRAAFLMKCDRRTL